MLQNSIIWFSFGHNVTNKITTIEVDIIINTVPIAFFKLLVK